MHKAKYQSKQDVFLLTINDVAKKLLSYNTLQSFDDIVIDCLCILGESVNQNRVYIWKDTINNKNELCCIQVYEWVKGTYSIQGNSDFENVSYNKLPTLKAALDKGECLNQLLYNMTASEQKLLEPQNIKSLLIAPIIINEVRWGFIGIDNCETIKLFTKQEENMLLTSGFMLASAILKQTTETHLRQSEELVQAMFDATPLCCNVWSNDFKLLTCNENAVKLFNLENKQDFLEQFPKLSPEFQPCGKSSKELGLNYVKEAFNTGNCSFEWLHQNLKNEPIPVHATLVRIKYKNENAVAAYVRDLRELKAKEVLYREAEERNTLMLNAMPLCCNFWDKNFNTITCNDEAVRLFELKNQQEYLDRFFELSPEIQPCGKLSSELALEKITRAFSEGYVHFEWLHQKLNGTPIPSEITLIRLLFKNEYFVVGYTRDLREHKAMLAEIQATQQKLTLARDEALAHSKAKSEFLVNMSHEIRTPMNGIIGLSYLTLQLPNIDPHLRDYIVKIDNSAKTLLRIINDILDFSKINAGKLDLEHIPFDLVEILEHTIQPLIPTVTDKGLEILFNFAKDTPTQLVGDPIRLQQVILNLVTNAIKFTHEGNIIIQIESLYQDQAKATLQFTVIDSGVGIAPAYLKKLFEAFTQADTSVTRRYGGTGLGLAICKQIVELMGGNITVSSTLEKGSTFSFTAQFELTEISNTLNCTQHCLTNKEILIADDSSSKEQQLIAARPLTNKHVLLAEDNEINQLIAIEILSGYGMTVTVAATGLEAVKHALTEEFDIILMDIQMPEMDGIEATKLIRKDHPNLNHIPIIAMTAHAMTGDYEKSITAGMQAHITKPINPEELYNTLLYWATTINNSKSKNLA